ncbi:hypothetical protein LJK87_44210 [Paenibacillus sp. P25]|nr:hypothetical protein LJK87_44210 [Paenibacillus sp. P25]
MAFSEDNYQKGLEVLARIDPEHYQAIVDSFRDSPAPDLGRLAVEFNYGQIFSRPGLDLKLRVACIGGRTHGARQYAAACDFT